MYGDVHPRVVVEILTFLNSVLEGNDDGTKLGSLVGRYWKRRSR